MTDLLVFESNTDMLTLAFDARRTITLGKGDKLWLLNVPTDMEEEQNEAGKKCEDFPKGDARDECLNVIENAHHVFDVLTNHANLPSTIHVKTKSKFKRHDPLVPEKFKHPCPEITLRYIPPDTDPCFVTQV